MTTEKGPLGRQRQVVGCLLFILLGSNFLDIFMVSWLQKNQLEQSVIASVVFQ